jgi:hypothetical protein
VADERDDVVASARGPGEGLVVVPRRPGPLVPLGSLVPDRDRDELDELIDELFGPASDERPGWFDLGLLVVGAGLVAWSVGGGAGGLALAVGIAAIVLGLVFPLRSAWRVMARRRLEHQRREVLAGGLPLRVSDAATARLARAYADLLDAAAPLGADALTGVGPVAAAHAAVLECASLLDGSVPGSEQERRYVAARASAMSELADALRRRHRAQLEPAWGEEAVPGAGPDRARVVEARTELEHLSGQSALHRLRELTEEASGP